MAASRKSSAGRRKARSRFPTRWLFTDERLGGASPHDSLWKAIRNLPRGSGIVFRHYTLPRAKRAELLKKVEQLAGRRGLIVVASQIRARSGGVHRPQGGRLLAAQGRASGLVTASAHSERELAEAFARGADLVFLSPVFQTRSHPGARALGPVRFGLIAQKAAGPVMALGGMGPRNIRRLKPLGAAGYGAIDAWS